MSVNLIPNVLNKLHRDKESTRTPVGSTGKSDEGSTSSVPQVSPLRIEWLSTLVTDECESLAQLALHIHSLLVSSASDLRAISLLILTTKFWAVSAISETLKWIHISHLRAVFWLWEKVWWYWYMHSLVIDWIISMIIKKHDGDVFILSAGL